MVGLVGWVSRGPARGRARGNVGTNVLDGDSGRRKGGEGKDRVTKREREKERGLSGGESSAGSR